MTGFVAALQLNGTGADCISLLSRPAARLSTLSLRVGLWSGDPVGMAQEHGAGAEGPWQGRPGGPVLCGDLALIDGRGLAAKAGCRYRGDALAILDAYDRWGAELPQHLEGEFSFVLWDPERRTLLAVRDRFGVKPLAYRVTPGCILLSSNAAALEAEGAAPDDRWIAAFLDGREQDDAATPFRGVLDLLPGHLLTVKGGTCYQSAWWQLAPVRIAEADAPAALAEALDAAVRDRMSQPCATLLSGGLDSSTITCLAARASDTPVYAVSVRNSARPELDEGQFIEAVRHGRNIFGVDIEAKEGAFEGLDEALRHYGRPIFAPNQAMPRQFYAAAARSGARVVLDGHGGDEVIGSGAWLFSELVFTRRWRSFLREGWRHRLAGADRPAFDKVLLGALAMSGPPIVRHAAQLLQGAVAQDEEPSFAATGIARQVGAEPSQSAVYKHDHLDPAARLHARLLLNRQTVDAFEFMGRIAQAAGIEARFPFYDRRVVAITLGQPTIAKIAPGQPRALLRRSMAGILPDVVRNRPDKTDFTPMIASAFTAERLDKLRALGRAMPERLRPHVDPSAVGRCISALGDGKQGFAERSALIRMIWLDRWLELREISAPQESPRERMAR